MTASRPTARVSRAVGWVLVGVVLAAAAGLWAHHRWQRIVVVSASMSPTIEPGETAWVDRGTTGAEVRVGDVVLFRDPGGWGDGADPIAKRVIAVGGQHLTCCRRDGRLEVDGRPVDEPYLAAGMRPSRLAFDVTVPVGTVWVMGDNREHSLDSRQHELSGGSGFVPLTSVLGVVVVRWTR